MPGHYFNEGLIVSQYDGDDTPIEATPGSAFYESLDQCVDPSIPCYGTAEEWVEANFPEWSPNHIPWNILYLIGLIVFTRIVTFWALTSLNYRST